VVEGVQQAAITEPLTGIRELGAAQRSVNIDPAHPVGVSEQLPDWVPEVTASCQQLAGPDRGDHNDVVVVQQPVTRRRIESAGNVLVEIVEPHQGPVQRDGVEQPVQTTIKERDDESASAKRGVTVDGLSGAPALPRRGIPHDEHESPTLRDRFIAGHVELSITLTRQVLRQGAPTNVLGNRGVHSEHRRLRDLSRGRRDTLLSQRAAVHVAAPHGSESVLHNRVEPHVSRRTNEPRILGEVRDRHNEQAALLAVGVHLHHHRDQTAVLVPHRRAGDPSPQGGVVGHGRIHIKRHQSSRTAQPAQRQQPTHRVFSIPLAAGLLLGIGEPNRLPGQRTLAQSGQPWGRVLWRIPSLVLMGSDPQHGKVEGWMKPEHLAVDPVPEPSRAHPSHETHATRDTPISVGCATGHRTGRQDRVDDVSRRENPAPTDHPTASAAADLIGPLGPDLDQPLQRAHR
jgi:hypothetical protein